ncbi:hypothetical protein SERLA73DRAFT_80366 [Serpula lacrymans var. lacrymans S7.3]|uniref:CCHC-type domain-containing protein n=1 Tax=Serpula lacrymans var. lacrymans (strain S7.3) TaxID=936435 RepID=F8QJJ4_SERL3|nr:hypothetical protein SERLA73DRAFT_80366 [Serpula lacrymans var. lacrymans S7.3]
MKFRSFMEHLSLHFEEDPTYFGYERKKIAFVLSYIKEGTAASFRSKWLEEKMSVSLSLERAQFQQWSVFEERLNEAFKNSYEEEEARSKILQLKQGTKTARDFFLEFDSLRRKAGYRDDSILITLIKINMNYTLVDKLPPKKYEEWRKLLLNYNQIWREREKEKKSYFGQTERARTRKDNGGGTEKKAYSETRDGTGTIYTGAGKPMEIDKAKYKKKGLCFKCGIKGHISKFCPTEGKNKIDLRAMIAALTKEEPKPQYVNPFSILPVKELVDTDNKKYLSNNSETKKEVRKDNEDANQKRGLVTKTPKESTTAAEAAHKEVTHAATAASTTLESAASAADTKKLTPDAAISTEKNTAETVKDRSGTPVNKNLEKE